MRPRTVLAGLVILAAAVLALLFYNAYDGDPAETGGVGLPSTTTP